MTSKQTGTSGEAFASQTVLTLLLITLSVVLFMPEVRALNIVSVSVTPASPGTASTLACIVNATGNGTLTANISWYQNNLLWIGDTETLPLTNGVATATGVNGSIEPISTSKGEYWRCEATVSNITASVAQNATAVLISNSPPVITFPTTLQSLTEDQTYSATATATDADGDTILLFLSSDLNSSLYNGTSLFTIDNDGDISATPTASKVGNHTMAILAFDGETYGGSNIVYEVVEFDDIPIIISPGNQNVTSGQGFSLSITASDEESDPLNFTITSNGTLTLLPTSNFSANVSFALGYPTSLDAGLYNVSIVAWQASNPMKNATTTFTVLVTEPNNASVFTSTPAVNGTQGTLFEYIILANDTNPADQLFFSVASPGCSITNPWSVNTTSNSSTGAIGIINVTLTNNHIICRSVRLSVSDYTAAGVFRSTTSYNITFNLTNTNDVPIIAEISAESPNYLGQKNASALSAAQDIAFAYVVNASDVDELTYAGDTLTFTSNDSLFTVGASSGLITATPGAGDVGRRLVGITAQDIALASVTRTLNITVYANAAPVLVPITNRTCAEDLPCTIELAALDDDAGENLTFSFNDSLADVTWLSVNTSRLNHTYANNEVSNYSLLLTVTDRWGASDSQIFTLQVNNTNDAPFFDSNRDNITNVLTLSAPVVIDVSKTWDVIMTDVDQRNIGDTINFTADIAGPNTGLFNITLLNAYTGRIQFTPVLADIGSYEVNIAVTDALGAFTSQNVTFAVVNGSAPPVITGARPYLNGSAQVNNTIVTTSNAITLINASENTTVVYNISFTDPDSVLANMTVKYYSNGMLVASPSASNPAYSASFDFFDAGVHEIMAVVEDNLLANDSFMWNTTVRNVKRAPILVSNLGNRTINDTTLLNNELSIIDPDDDLDSNLAIDGSEINTLVYSVSANAYFTAAFVDSDVTITPASSGSITFTYLATTADSAYSLYSNIITYTIFYNPEEEESSSSSSSSSGGGGGGGGGGGAVVIKPIPRPQPYAINLIVPKPLTVYENATVIVPIALVNTGNLTLKDIDLTATSEAEVELGFITNTVKELAPDETFNTSLAIKNYKLGGTFEIIVTAVVGEPSFNDSAVLFLNSLERTSTGDAVNTKVTSARDLLSQDPVCGELAELVDQAEVAIASGDNMRAAELLEAATDGCAYLKTIRRQELQQPAGIEGLAAWSTLNWALGGLLIALIVIGATLVIFYARQK